MGSSQCLVFIPGLKIINRENLTDGCMNECGTMRRFLALFLFSCLIGVIKGYNWQPVLSDSFPWRACSAFEATKDGCTTTLTSAWLQRISSSIRRAILV